MTLKKHFKTGIRLILDSNGSITTIVIRLSKQQLLEWLDKLIPDDPQ